MPRLAVEHLDARHGLLHAVRDVSLQLDQGEVVALVGANGAGKTTTIRTLMNLIGPTTGYAAVLGVNTRA
ncbi:MAG: ATP-binding cassette domain-containing protein, partial [Aliidongia sp.]